MPMGSRCRTMPAEYCRISYLMETKPGPSQNLAGSKWWIECGEQSPAGMRTQEETLITGEKWNHSLWHELRMGAGGWGQWDCASLALRRSFCCVGQWQESSQVNCTDCFDQQCFSCCVFCWTFMARARVVLATGNSFCSAMDVLSSDSMFWLG